MATETIYLGNPLLKKANVQQEFTVEQVEEFIRCKEDPFIVAIKGTKYRNDFRKGFAEDIHNRLHKMKKEEKQNGRQLQIADKTVNQSALAVIESNKTEKGIIQKYKDDKYGNLPSKTRLTGAGGDGRSSGVAAGSSVGLSRQVAGGGQKRLSGV